MALSLWLCLLLRLTLSPYLSLSLFLPLSTSLSLKDAVQAVLTSRLTDWLID